MDNPEQSIKLKDLVYVILCDWRRIILFALIGAILVGAYGFYKNSQMSSSAPSSKEPVVLTDKEIDAVKAGLGETNKDYIKTQMALESLKEDICTLDDRLSNSFFLNIDWNAPLAAALDIRVLPEEPPMGSEETWPQRQYLLSLEFLRFTKSQDYYHYLAMSVEKGPEEAWVYELVTGVRGDDNVIHLEMVAPDRTLLNQLVEASQRYFSYEIREKLSLTYLFDVEITSGKVVTGIDPELVGLRSELEKKYEQGALQLSELQDYQEEIIEEALEAARLEKQIAEDEANASAPQKKQSIKKLVVVGAFLGLLVTVFWSVIRASSLGVIRDVEHFSDTIGLLFIGSVTSKRERPTKNIGQAIDDWLEHLFYGRSEKGSVGRAVAIIRGIMGDKHKTVALLTDETSFFTDTLAEILNTESITGIMANLKDEAGVKALQKADAAILIARAREIKVRDAMRTIEIASSMGKALLGVIAEE